MALLPTTKRIAKEDVKNAPDWFTPFLTQVNTFFSAVYDALNGQLTFGDNIAGFFKTLTFSTLSTYTASGTWNQISFLNTLRKKATGVLIMQISQQAGSYTPIKKAVSLDWTELNGSIILGFVSGLNDSTTYNLKLLVI